MNIFRADFHPPQEFKNSEIILFPTDENYFLTDYEAVMKSREALRIWSQSDWPEDHFTAEQNKEDLLFHVEDNHTHQAYGYMIYSLNKKRCFGSLYVNPLTSVPENYAMTFEQIEILKKFDVRVDYWISSEEHGLEKRITGDLFQWLKTGWNLRPLMACRREMKERQQVLRDLKLSETLDLAGKDGKSNLVLYSDRQS